MAVNWITLLAWVLFGFVSAHFAAKRGRNPIAWFVLGMLLGALGIFCLFLLPRRQMVEPAAAPVAEPYLPTLSEEDQKKFWYYLDGTRNQCGPMSFSALFRELKSGTISPKTLVWNENLEQWTTLSEFVTSSPSSPRE